MLAGTSPTTKISMMTGSACTASHPCHVSLRPEAESSTMATTIVVPQNPRAGSRQCCCFGRCEHRCVLGATQMRTWGKTRVLQPLLIHAGSPDCWVSCEQQRLQRPRRRIPTSTPVQERHVVRNLRPAAACVSTNSLGPCVARRRVNKHECCTPPTPRITTG